MASGQSNSADPGLGLQVRVGINTGEAVVALGARAEQGEGIVTGDVVNTASRLQGAAPVGAVVVGEQTRRATREVFDYEPLDPVRVKGKSEPIPLWRAKAARVRLREEEVAPTPFIGRAHELALLKETYARTVSESFVQLVTITGEPGVGKTRLISELRSFVDQEPELVIWRQGRCLPYGEGITFWALGEIVKAQAGILESDSPERATSKLDAAIQGLVEEASDREWVKTRLAPLVGAREAEPPGTVERGEYFTAWRRFLEGLASDHPVVLVFEDLHWADPAMLEFVDHLVDWATGVPLLVVCTARPELFESNPGWGGGKRNSTTISLAPLTAFETARLISALLFEAVLPAETQAALLERSGGNPLYAEEFVLMLIDRGILERRGRAVHIAAGMEIPVPENVQALIAARLDTLSPDRKALLQDAAVVGKVFWSGAVATIGGIDEGLVREGLHELARKELVRPARTSSVKDQQEYSFWHLLVRDVAYGQIPRPARVRKHRAAAQWIERIAGERITDHAEVLAHHYLQAMELAQVSGGPEEAKELEEPARRFLVLAGDRAMQFDVGRAEPYYRRALELFPPDHPEQPRVLTKAAEAAFFSGEFAEAELDYEQAIGALRAQGNPLGVADAMVSLSFVHGFRGKTARSRELLDEVIELLERESPGAELARAYAQMARERMMLGRPQECLEWAGKALDLGERLDLPLVVVMALQFRGNARCQLGDLAGMEDLQKALQMSPDVGRTNEVLRSHINYGDWVWLTEGPARALEVFREGIDFGERRGITGPINWMRGESLWMLFDLGDWDELLRVADQLISWDREHGGSYFGVMALSYKARVLLWRGEVAEAAMLAEEFLPRARAIEDPQVLAPALAIAATIEGGTGDLATARALVEELERLTRGRPDYRAQNLMDGARMSAATGAFDLGELILEGVDQTATRHRIAVVTGNAVLDEARQELEAAAKLYDEAARQWSEFGHRLEHGLALLGAGRCLLRLGSAGQARAQLRDARDVFAELGARPLVAETDALLERATALTS